MTPTVISRFTFDHFYVEMFSLPFLCLYFPVLLFLCFLVVFLAYFATWKTFFFFFLISVYDSDSSDPVTRKKAAEGVAPGEQARDF